MPHYWYNINYLYNVNLFLKMLYTISGFICLFQDVIADISNQKSILIHTLKAAFGEFRS